MKSREKYNKLRASVNFGWVAVLALFFFSSSFSFGQLAVSLPEHSTLSINPALSGATGFYRLNFDSRSQWKSLGNPFKTTQASFDIALSKDDTKKQGGYFGLGFYALSDAGGEFNFAQKQVMLSAAYHLKMTAQSRLSVGFQTGLVQHRLDQGDGRWGSQFTGIEYDPSRPSGEQIGSDAYSDLSLGLGMHYAWSQAKAKRGYSLAPGFSAGASALQVASAEIQKSGGLRSELFPRYNAYLRGVWPISEPLGIEPSYLFRMESGTVSHLFGADLRYVITDGEAFISKAKPFSVAGGFLIRSNEAVVLRGNVRWSDFNVSIAYDFATSDVRQYVSGRGGFEVGFGWWVADRKQKPN